MNKMTLQDLSVLKYYKNGNELCGFEDVHDNLVEIGYLDGDLELTHEGYLFIKNFERWDEVEQFENKMKITIKIK